MNNNKSNNKSKKIFFILHWDNFFRNIEKCDIFPAIYYV